jgi:hypothetical protein
LAAALNSEAGSEEQEARRKPTFKGVSRRFFTTWGMGDVNAVDFNPIFLARSREATKKRKRGFLAFRE